MNSANAQWVQAVTPVAIVNGASWTGAVIDTRGFAYAELCVLLGALDIALTALEVHESDASGSGFAAVTGLVFGTSTNSAGSTSTLPAATDDGKNLLFNIDLKGRKRYIKLVATIGSGSAGGYLAAVARLSRADVTPISATGMGASQVLQAPTYA